jgi:hypothetical protein
MKTAKILSLLILGIALLSFASATIVVKGYFGDDVHNSVATINEGESATLKVIFTSLDTITQKNIQFPTGVSSNGGCTFEGHTYTCIYSVSSNDEGTYSIKIIGKDNANGVDNSQVTLIVLPKTPCDTEKPVITIIGSNPTIYVGDSYTDAGATAWDNKDGDITSNIHTSSNVNTNAVGTYSVTYTVSDKAGNAAEPKTRTVKVIAKPIPTNHVPKITSTPIISVNELSQYSYQVIASDEDGDALTYSVTGASWLSINSNGLITGTAPSVNSDTSFSITVTVSDGKLSTTQTYTLKVKNICSENHAPKITSTPDKTTDEEDYYSYQVTATDEDNDALSYSFIQHPSWLSISSNGLITGTAPSVSENTDYAVVVRVSDGKTSVTQTYTLTVEDTYIPSHLPTINVISPVDKVYKTEKITFKVETDGDGVYYVLNHGSKVNMDNDYSNVFTDSVVLSNGEYEVTFYAVNEHGKTSKTVEFTVKVGTSGCASNYTPVDFPTTTNDVTVKGTGSVIADTTNKKTDNSWIFYILIAVIVLGILITFFALIKRLNQRY